MKISNLRNSENYYSLFCFLFLFPCLAFCTKLHIKRLFCWFQLLTIKEHSVEKHKWGNIQILLPTPYLAKDLFLHNKFY